MQRGVSVGLQTVLWFCGCLLIPCGLGAGDGFTTCQLVSLVREQPIMWVLRTRTSGCDDLAGSFVHISVGNLVKCFLIVTDNNRYPLPRCLYGAQAIPRIPV